MTSSGLAASRQFVLVELGDSDQDTLDFYLLLKKAEQLGINYSPEGIVDLIAHDTLGRLGDDLKGALPIERQLRDGDRMGDFTHDWLIEAIGNEYRARDTLAALQGMTRATASAEMRARNPLALFLLGGDADKTPIPGALNTASALPGAVTPYEFFEFYKDRCSEHTFDMLEVSAEDFLSQVKGEPTPRERIALFNKYRGELPDPSKERPGFKEPRKVKLEYVALDATSKRITEAIPKLHAAETFLWASAGAMDGNPMAALMTASRSTLDRTLPIQEEVRKKMDANLSRYQDFEQYYFTPRNVSVYRPETIVGLLGALGGYPSQTAAAAAVSLPLRYAERHDLKTRVPFLLQAWLTPFNPTMGNALGMPAFAYALNPKLPPVGLYLKEVTETARKNERRKLLQDDIQELRTKLFKIQSDNGLFTQRQPDKATIEKVRAEAKKFMMEWLKNRGLKPTGNSQPEDKFALVSDPALKVLNDLAAKEPDGSNSLVNRLFTVDPQTGQPVSGVEPYEPFWFPGEPSGESLDKPNYLVWVAEEKSPNAYPSLENADRQTNGEMTKRVVHAWKLEKARALAKAEADRISEQVRSIAKEASSNPEGVIRQLRDLAAEKKLRTIVLPGLAMLKFEHEATRAAPGSYSPPKIDKSQVTYPTADFADQLLELRKQPVGGVTVLPDAPQSHYYVACEISRQEKNVDQFRDVFGKTNATGVAQNQLYQGHALQEDRMRAINEVRERLHADAKLEEKEAFKNKERETE